MRFKYPALLNHVCGMLATSCPLSCPPYADYITLELTITILL